MNPYYQYSAEELAADSSFQNWVLRADTQDIKFWEQWLTMYPERAETCYQAKILVLAIRATYQENELTELEVQQQVQHLLEHATQPTHRHPIRFIRWGGWQVAAAVLLVITGVWLFQQKTLARLPSKDNVASTSSSVIKRANTQNHPLTILLSDGSVVTLSPRSSLSYPRVFAKEQRSVTLMGEAFFEVTKNPDRPFHVLTDRSVTKVLGTSFRVRAFPKEPTEKVTVRTGRVAVYAYSAVTAKISSVPVLSNGVLLIPNQQVEIRENQLEKPIAVLPKQVAAPNVGPSEISFDDQPVTDVLLTLARLYEVTIEFDSQRLANCRITTSFAEETLPERLNSICRAINATYKIENDQIRVSSHGCISAM